MEDGVQEEEYYMQLSQPQAAALSRALKVLTHGHSNRFEDELWLGFGDEWWPLRERLLKGSYVRSLGGIRDELTVTERGENLLTQLQGKQRAAG
jgi:hypothetical protein